MIYDVTTKKTEIIISKVDAASEEEAKNMIERSDICLQRYTLRKNYEITDCKKSRKSEKNVVI